MIERNEKGQVKAISGKFNLLPQIPGSEFGTVVCNMVLLCWLETFWRMI